MTNTMEFDFGENGGGNLKFDSKEKLLEYVNNQTTKWGEILGLTTDSDTNFSGAVINSWNVLANTINQYPIPEQLDHIRNVISQYMATKNLISINSVNGQILKTIIEKTGKSRVAFGALNTLQNKIPNPQTAEDLQGLALFTLMDNGLKPSGLALSKTTVNEIANQLNKIYNDFHEHLETKSTDLVTRFEGIVKRFNEYVDKADIQLESQQKFFEEFKSRADNEWQSIVAAYNEQMKLKAPVEYWEEKSKSHKQKYEEMKEMPIYIVFCGAFILALIVWGTWEGVQHLISEIYTNNSATKIGLGEVKDLIKYQFGLTGAITLLFVTLYIWAIRFFVRLLITEQHLQIDAQSRAVMAQTYLALIKEGRADETDRPIVLATLFKPVTDGLVRDDGMPLFSPASFVMDKLTK